VEGNLGKGRGTLENLRFSNTGRLRLGEIWETSFPYMGRLRRLCGGFIN
jgi:hypothetical protein